MEGELLALSEEYTAETAPHTPAAAAAGAAGAAAAAASRPKDRRKEKETVKKAADLLQQIAEDTFMGLSRLKKYIKCCDINKDSKQQHWGLTPKTAAASLNPLLSKKALKLISKCTYTPTNPKP